MTFSDQANGDPRCDAGYMAEVLLYNRILNSTELTNTHNYLLNKWGISTLVSNVPVTGGLNLWLDAFDPSNVITDNNSNVLLWRDKSLCNWHLSNYNAIKAPTYTSNGINSLPSVYFPNNSNAITQSYLVNPNISFSTPSATLYMVMKYLNPINGISVFSLQSNSNTSGTDSNGGFSIKTFGSNSANHIEYVRFPNIFSYSLNISNNALATFQINNTFSTIGPIQPNTVSFTNNGNLNGQNTMAYSTTSLFNSQCITVGGDSSISPGSSAVSNVLWGYISEVLLYNRSLGFAEKQQVESYLMSKWKL